MIMVYMGSVFMCTECMWVVCLCVCGWCVYVHTRCIKLAADDQVTIYRMPVQPFWLPNYLGIMSVKFLLQQQSGFTGQQAHKNDGLMLEPLHCAGSQHAHVCVCVCARACALSPVLNDDAG